MIELGGITKGQLIKLLERFSDDSKIITKTTNVEKFQGNVIGVDVIDTKNSKITDEVIIIRFE